MSANPNTTEQKKIIFLEALKKNLNVVTAACEQTGVGRTTYYDWLRLDPEFKKKAEEISEIQFDFVETQLLKKIKEGSESSIIFYMKTKGKKKGYGQNIDVTTNGENMNKIQIEIINPIKKEDNKDEDTGY